VKGVFIFSITVFASIFTINPVFGQYSETDSSKQITLSGDLANDPTAQDILKKIEQSKKQIAQIQQNDLEQNEAQQNLEKKRTEALAILQNDLREWEKLWEEFTFEYKFARQSGFGWDVYNFTNTKIMAGRDALQQVLDQGGNAVQARQAYAEAAKIKRSEMIDVNALLNVKYNLALYNQQILFDSNGQFHDIISGDQLRKYYQDYRLDPAYLSSNLKDEISWKEMSKDIQTVCRDGHVLVYRFHANDHVCVTEQTAEIWVIRDMGNILFNESSQSTDTPTIEKLKKDRLDEKIKNINNKILSAYDAYDEKINDVNKKYQSLVLEYTSQQRDEEQKTIAEFKGASLQVLDQRINDIRKNYEYLEEILMQEKFKTFEILESNHKQSMENFIQTFGTLSDVKIIWNSDKSQYEAVQM
jgi:hypothetical protein